MTLYHQVGQQDLPFGLKFNAKGVLDCYEGDLETSSGGRRRDIQFNMVEGDFQTFQGSWSIEQVRPFHSFLAATAFVFLLVFFSVIHN